MHRHPAISRPARPLPTPLPPPAPAPTELWGLRDNRTGSWVRSYQESNTINNKIIVTCLSLEAAEEAVEFYRTFTFLDPVAVKIL